jgi:hypothetical protein
MSEAAELEPIAIALFESFARARAVPMMDWLRLTGAERDGWRHEAKAMINEAERLLVWAKDAGVPDAARLG